MTGSLVLPGSASCRLLPAATPRRAVAVPGRVHPCRVSALRPGAAPAHAASSGHRHPLAPPRAIAQLYAVAAGLPFVLSSGAVAATGAGAGQEFSAAPFSVAMAVVAVALFAGEAYQRQAAGETFDLQAEASKVLVYDPEQQGGMSESAAAPSVSTALPEPAVMAATIAPEKDVTVYYGTLVPAAAVAAAAAVRARLVAGGPSRETKVVAPPADAALRLAAVAAAPLAFAAAQAQAEQQERAAAAAAPAEKPEALAEQHADKVQGLWQDFTARASRAAARGRGAGAGALASVSSYGHRLAVVPASVVPPSPAEAIAAARGAAAHAAAQRKSLYARLAAFFTSWWSHVLDFISGLTNSPRGSASSAAP